MELKEPSESGCNDLNLPALVSYHDYEKILVFIRHYDTAAFM